MAQSKVGGKLAIGKKPLPNSPKPTSVSVSPEPISFYCRLRATHVCPGCEKTFDELKVFSKHLVEDHGFVYKHSCDYCGLGSNKLAMFREHKSMCRDWWPDAKKRDDDDVSGGDDDASDDSDDVDEECALLMLKGWFRARRP